MYYSNPNIQTSAAGYTPPPDHMQLPLSPAMFDHNSPNRQAYVEDLKLVLDDIAHGVDDTPDVYTPDDEILAIERDTDPHLAATVHKLPVEPTVLEPKKFELMREKATKGIAQDIEDMIANPTAPMVLINDSEPSRDIMEEDTGEHIRAGDGRHGLGKVSRSFHNRELTEEVEAAPPQLYARTYANRELAESLAQYKHEQNIRAMNQATAGVEAYKDHAYMLAGMNTYASPAEEKSAARQHNRHVKKVAAAQMKAARKRGYRSDAPSGGPNSIPAYDGPSYQAYIKPRQLEKTVALQALAKVNAVQKSHEEYHRTYRPTMDGLHVYPDEARRLWAITSPDEPAESAGSRRASKRKVGRTALTGDSHSGQINTRSRKRDKKASFWQRSAA